jgi:hypothetical protein
MSSSHAIESFGVRITVAVTWANGKRTLEESNGRVNLDSNIGVLDAEATSTGAPVDEESSSASTVSGSVFAIVAMLLVALLQ